MSKRIPFKRTAPRRGITLIFVVTMIVLFLLMGTAFVIVSNDFLSSARQRRLKHIYDSDSKSLLERAFYELARGPDLSNDESPLRGHSLLADMYGYGVSATIDTATADSSEHFMILTLNGDGKKLIDGSSFTPDPVTGSMSGLLLGVVSGPSRGLTTRIIDHQVTGDSSSGFVHTFIVLPSRIDKDFSVANAPSLVGRKVVINGRPFSGSGAGHYLPNSAQGTAALSNMAIYPNQVGRSKAQLLGQTGAGYFSVDRDGVTEPNSGGPNEGYDTFDFQNMFLAGILPDGTIARSSFHREELPTTRSDGATGDFRAFASGAQSGSDVRVDNNNDGIPDGIWMDIGLPVETQADGVLVKPLVSYLVLDMDGRINLNAHGSQVVVGGWTQEDGSPADRLSMPDKIPFLGTPGSDLKRGQGFGPPEIQMGLVVANEVGVIQNRYGADGKPGLPNERDTWSRYKLYGFPEVEFGALIPGTVNGHFASAMDVHGRFAYGFPQIFDVAGDRTFPIGMPVADVGFSSLPNEVIDSPYEMNFADGNSYGAGFRLADNPYTANELESVFRKYDPDSTLLPRRLIDLGLGGNSTKNSVTTHSFEVPTTYQSLPEQLYLILEEPISDFNDLTGLPSSADRDEEIRNQLRRMLPAEIFRGLPMNVNRIFGDGIDNNGNGVVDEMGESDVLVHPNGDHLEFDHDNDSLSSGDLDSMMARITFARHLYMVTLLNTERIDRDGDGRISLRDWYDFNEDGTPDQQDWIDFRKVVAQWAANVVDFRDPDSIMTPVEFDLNPWNGWDVDGSILTEESLVEESVEMRFTVWGSERPELLISETLATHDRRTQDLETESVMAPDSASRVDDGDEDFDSHLVPKVSAFFELYNPWVMNDANQIRPAELYDDTLGGVDLQKTSLDGTSPVWRLGVVDTTAEGQELYDPDRPENNPGQTEVSFMRRIYFARPSFSVDQGPEVFFPEEDIESGYVGPGQYAIVGTAGKKLRNRYDTYFGRRLTEDALESDELQSQTRRFSLNPTERQFEYVEWDADESEMKTVTKPVVTLPIGLNDGGWERDLGVSDPLEGYFNLQGPGGVPIDLTPIADGWKFTEDITTPRNPDGLCVRRARGQAI